MSRFPRKSRGRADGSRGDWRLHGLLIPLWSDLEAFLNFFHHPNLGQMDFGREPSWCAPGRLWASSSSGLDYAIRCFGLRQMDISCHYISKICINLVFVMK